MRTKYVTGIKLTNVFLKLQTKHGNTNVCNLKCDKGYKVEGESFIECDDIESDDEDVQRWIPDPKKSHCVIDRGSDYNDFSICSPPKKLPLGDWKMSSDSSSALLTCPTGFVTPGEVVIDFLR